MLEVTNENAIYLTKGDSGTLNITVKGEDVSTMDLKFTVRNAKTLDNVMFVISTDATETSETEAGKVGTAETTGTNTWTIRIFKNATADLKRNKYVYDFALENAGDKITFVGGGAEKTEFWIT